MAGVMRLMILAAAVVASLVLARPAPAAAQTLGQACLLHETAADPAASEAVRGFLARRPGMAVMTCSSDRGVTHQAMSPVRIEAPGACRMSVQRFSEAGLAGAATAQSPQAGAFEFMAEPDSGECPARGKGRWIAVTDVPPEDFVRISRFAGDLTRGGGRSAQRDRGCRKREDKLRGLAVAHALISVRRETPGVYAIQLLRSGAGYTASLELTADGVCVRGFGNFII